MKTKGKILINNYTYWFEHKLASNGDLCLSTKDPGKYCNGLFAYSSKDPGNGVEFVIVRTNNPVYFDHGIFKNGL